MTVADGLTDVAAVVVGALVVKEVVAALVVIPGTEVMILGTGFTV